MISNFKLFDYEVDASHTIMEIIVKTIVYIGMIVYTVVKIIGGTKGWKIKLLS